MPALSKHLRRAAPRRLARWACLASVALWLGALAACATPPEAQREAPQRKSLAERHPEDPRVGRYVSAPWSFSTASYWIEGPEGVVVIDTQFVFSAAEELIADAERITGKKVVLAVVLHANPDKFNGTEVFQRRNIKVITSSQVLAQLPKIHEKRVAAFYDRYKPDYPLDLPKPDAFGDATTEVSAGGVTLKLHVMGPACSEAHVVAEFDGHLFAGDMLANGVHSWLEIGRTDEWLKRLDELEALQPRFVHPGRGAWGGPSILRDERAYLQAVIEAVAAEQPQGRARRGRAGPRRGRPHGALPRPPLRRLLEHWAARRVAATSGLVGQAMTRARALC